MIRAPRHSFAATFRVLTLIGVLALSVGCSTEPDLTLSTDYESAIRDGIASLMAAANRGDWAGWTDAYADDAVVMPPNSPPITGRPALEQLLAELPPTSGWAYNVVDLDGRGDLAFVRAGPV